MKIGKIRGVMYSASRRVSELCQTSSLGGIAAAWALKANTAPEARHMLIWAMVFFLGALAFDFLQHVWRTAAYGYLQSDREKGLKKKGDDEEVLGPSKWINRVTAIFFWTKIAVMITGFVVLLIVAFALLWE